VVRGPSGASYWKGQMTTSSTGLRRYEIVAISSLLAAVFIYAALDKFRDPLQFADSVAAFGILPTAVIAVFALSLPPFEILCGLLMLPPGTRRVAALAVALACAMFFIALASALLRGLTLDCGCFGASAPSRPRMWLEAGLDVVLFGVALFVYLRTESLTS
jgi:putative oxidoreductase